MKKSVFCIAAALLLSLCLVSCRNNGGENSTENGSVAESAENGSVQSSEQLSEQVTEDGTEKGSEINSTEQPTDANTEGETSGSVTDDGQKEPDDRIFVRSNTGTDLNLVVGYTVDKHDDGSYTVNADIGLESYSLTVTARQNTNYLKVGDETYYYSTDAIDYKGDQLTVFDFGSHSFTVPAGTISVPLYAIWYFNGTYSQKPMTAIVAEAEIVLE